MAGQQRAQWNSSSRAHRTSLVDNKDLKQKYKTFHDRPAYSSPWSPATDFSEIVAESRSHQLRKQIDPRGHLLDVLDVQAPSDKTLGVTERRASMVKAGTLNNLQVPPKMLVSDSLLRATAISDAGPVGGKFLFSRASTMRYTNARLTSQLSPVEERGCAAVEERPPSDNTSAHDSPPSAPPPGRRWSEPPRRETFSDPGQSSHDSATLSRRRFSEPERIPRTWSDPGRNPTADAERGPLRAVHFSRHRWPGGVQPVLSDAPYSPRGKHPLDNPRLQIWWRGLDRSFDSEFFPERFPGVHTPLVRPLPHQQDHALAHPAFPERSHTPLVRAARVYPPPVRTVST